MLLKLSAALLVTSAFGAAGLVKSQQLMDKSLLSQSIGELLQRCSFLIRYASLDVYAISADIRQSESFSQLSFLRELPADFVPESDFSSQWTTALSSQRDIPHEEADILRRLGTLLGASDAESQLLAISALESEAEQLKQRRTAEYQQKARLYRSLGLLFGIMAGILVI